MENTIYVDKINSTLENFNCFSNNSEEGEEQQQKPKNLCLKSFEIKLICQNTREI